MQLLALLVPFFALLTTVVADSDASGSTSATPTVVTATRLVKSLAPIYPYFVTNTEAVVWTQTPVPVAA
ncbi:hypothetical protein EW146_g5343 [Bondarzewia mesenterica]|uniref:Uncharacterized protein n=1 Tax=Bondarzewia mesenterica TaxID=1095465 RepID=A0A4S4LTV1_9AGAM|nr:hypothetical protein EW146_g5343 [Bondarzewia mesenterica]